jgi:peptidoglycan/LPS O-acetylase OafA/YrhL
MGTLRVIFALTVVLTHCWPGGMQLVGGVNAVRLFYMVSGFLISYILTERSPRYTLRDFYLNRLLRLYPIYILVAFATFALYAPRFLDVYRSLPPVANLFLAFSNVSIFGQDWLMFTGIRDGAMRFAVNFRDSDVALYLGLWVPQAWTLGLELSFYALAPFILTRRAVIWVLLLASLGIRGLLWYLGLAAIDPWNYRFLPAELSLFLIGSLAHQYGLPWYRKLSPRILKQFSAVSVLAFALFTIAYPFVSGPEAWKEVFLLASFAFLLPLFFQFQLGHRADRVIGDLSYPIYIVHILVILFVSHFASHLGGPAGFALACVLVTVACAWVLNIFVGKPVERLRESIRFRRKAT